MTYALNAELNGIEISFTEKPASEILHALKALGFRWHNVKKLWYAKQNAERLALAEKIAGGKQAENVADQKTNGTPQNHIKIYWNGLKVDNGKLIKCGFDRRDGYVRIWARDYDRLPRDLFDVENNSDSYTDYFENDSASVPTDHPLYKYVEYAAIKSRIHDTKQGIKYYSGRGTAYKTEVERLQAELVKLEKELKADPGQPTQEDLDQIDRQRQEAENARRAAEHEAELKEREKFLNARCNGMHLIEKMQKVYPIKENSPVVTILWSESPKFAAFQDGSLKLSVAAADVILRTFDKEFVEENGEHSGYDKTKFRIDFTKDGKTDFYEGRYDLGDNENGLIDHIRSFGTWYLTHDQYGHELKTPEQTNEVVEFANWLEAQIDKKDITITTPFGKAMNRTKDQALRYAICKFNGITSTSDPAEKLEMINKDLDGIQFTVEDLTQ